MPEHLFFLEENVEPLLVMELGGVNYFSFFWGVGLTKEFIGILFNGNGCFTL